MNKISIKNIKFKAFRSFAEQQETGALEECGLYGIKGFNTNTNGSSGAGKSNFHLAISYALGYSPFFDTELQSWLTNEEMQVELHLQTPSGPAILKRGKETSIRLNDQLLKGVKPVNAALKSIIGMPIDLLDALTFRQQRKPGRFLSMTDKEKKEFLSKLLGLEELEPQIKTAIKKANETEKQALQFKAVLEALESSLPPPPSVSVLLSIDDVIKKYASLLKEKESLTSKITELEALICLEQKKIQAIEGRIFTDTDTGVNNPDLIKLETLLQQCNTRILALEEVSKAELASLHDDLSFETKSLASYQKEADKLSGFLEKLSALDSKIDGIKANKCPTCTQQWTPDTQALADMVALRTSYELSVKAATYSKENISKIAQIRDEISQKILNYSNEDLKQLKVMQGQIKDKITETKANISAENYRKLNEFNESKKKEIDLINTITRPWIFEQRSLQEKLYNTQALIAATKAEQAGIERTNQSLVDQYHKDEANFKAQWIKINKAREDYNSLMLIAKTEADFASVLKSFLGAIFEEVLVEISDETNSMLKVIPNVSTMTLQFSTESVTQEEVVRQEIKPVIQKSGVSVSLRSGLSGGQLTSVELAVDLAIGTIIGRRTGIMPGWLILDESFDGHGIPEKEACLELLKNAAKDRLILVIDHASEIKEYFDKFICIESTNDVSRIEGIH